MKRLNLGLNIASVMLNFIMLISLAWIGSNAFWWMFSPLATDPYIYTPPVNQYDNSIKYINNRAPFGVIIVEKPKVALVNDNIKLTGIYLNTVKDSIVFLEVNSKPIIAKIGDEILPGTKIETINATKVVLNSNGTNQDLTLQRGSTEANAGISIPSNSQQNNSRTEDDDNNNTKSNATVTGSPQNTDSNMEEVRARRKKMIDEMMKSDRQNSDSTVNNK